MPELVHGTAVAVAGRAVLLRGASGAGKSDLALRLITGRNRFPGLAGSPILVADDYLHVAVSRARITLTAPETIAGLLEVRGVGILTVPFVAKATLVLVVDLDEARDVARLPESETTGILGIRVQRLALRAFEASAPAKVLAALAAASPAARRRPATAKPLASRHDTRQT